MSNRTGIMRKEGVTKKLEGVQCKREKEGSEDGQIRKDV